MTQATFFFSKAMVSKQLLLINLFRMLEEIYFTGSHNQLIDLDLACNENETIIIREGERYEADEVNVYIQNT